MPYTIEKEGECERCGTPVDIVYEALSWREKKRLIFTILFGIPAFAAMPIAWGKGDYFLTALLICGVVIIASTLFIWMYHSEQFEENVKMTPRVLNNKGGSG